MLQKLPVTLILLALAAAPAAAQLTRTEVIKPTTPADDAKRNSPSVPDVAAATGQFKRIVVLRFKYRTDLLAGLAKYVKEQNVRDAVILAGAGSLRGYHVHSVSNRTFPSKNIYLKDPTAPADIVSMNGYVMNGKLHVHVALTDERHGFGGHLEAGSEVFTFAIVTLGILSDEAKLDRFDDKTWR